MKVVSLSVGLPREVEWEGHTVLTSIFKEPVERRLRVSSLNFEGDEQSDLTVHGGVDKAVCRLAVPPQLRVGCHPSRETNRHINAKRGTSHF